MKAIDLFSALKDRVDTIPMVFNMKIPFNENSIEILQKKGDVWRYYRAKLGSGHGGRKPGEFVTADSKTFFEILEKNTINEKRTIERFFNL